MYYLKQVGSKEIVHVSIVLVLFKHEAQEFREHRSLKCYHSCGVLVVRSLIDTLADVTCKSCEAIMHS